MTTGQRLNDTNEIVIKAQQVGRDLNASPFPDMQFDTANTMQKELVFDFKIKVEIWHCSEKTIGYNEGTAIPQPAYTMVDASAGFPTYMF